MIRIQNLTYKQRQAHYKKVELKEKLISVALVIGLFGVMFYTGLAEVV